MAEHAPLTVLHHLLYLNLSHGSRRTRARGRHFGSAAPHDVEFRTANSESIQSPPARTVLKWYMLTGCVCCGVIVGNYYFPATVSQPLLRAPFQLTAVTRDRCGKRCASLYTSLRQG